MSNESKGQVHSFEDQEQFQAPPEVLAQPTQEQLDRKIRNKKIFIFGGVGLVFFVMVIVAAKLMLNPGNGAPPAEPTPTPVMNQGPTVLEQELKRLKSEADEADPATEPFAPPPVDMEVEF